MTDAIKNRFKECGKCSVAEFHAHRAALSVSPVCENEKENLEFAINGADAFLE